MCGIIGIGRYRRVQTVTQWYDVFLDPVGSISRISNCSELTVGDTVATRGRFKTSRAEHGAALVWEASLFSFFVVVVSFFNIFHTLELSLQRPYELSLLAAGSYQHVPAVSQTENSPTVSCQHEFNVASTLCGLFLFPLLVTSNNLNQAHTEGKVVCLSSCDIMRIFRIIFSVTVTHPASIHSADRVPAAVRRISKCFHLFVTLQWVYIVLWAPSKWSRVQQKSDWQHLMKSPRQRDEVK